MMRIFSILLAVTLLFSVSQASAETKIRVTLQLPETHSLGQNWLAFKEMIERKSKGELAVELFPSAKLYKDAEVPKAVGTGVIEAGSAVLGRFADHVPVVEVVNLPFLFEDEAHFRAATTKGSTLRELIDQKILSATGARVLWWQAFGRNIYLSKGEAIRKPEDLKGKRVRTYGNMLSQTVKTLGGAPQLISGSKQFKAYQQGDVDVGMTGVSSVESRKLYQAMNNMTLSFDSAIEFVAVINNDFFESLSPDYQKIITEAALTVEKQLRDHIYQEEKAIVERLRTKINVIDLSTEDRKAWQAATNPVVEKFRKDFGQSGEAIITAIQADQK